MTASRRTIGVPQLPASKCSRRVPHEVAGGCHKNATSAGICPGVDSASQPSMENAHVARLLLRTARISRSADMGTDAALCFAGVPYASMHPAAIATTASPPPRRLSTRAWERVMIGQLLLLWAFSSLAKPSLR